MSAKNIASIKIPALMELYIRILNLQEVASYYIWPKLKFHVVRITISDIEVGLK